MPLVAVTRLRIRSYRFLVPFAWQAWRSFRQAKQAAASLGVKVRTVDGLAYWTLTAWQDEAAMNAYRIGACVPAGARKTHRGDGRTQAHFQFSIAGWWRS
jgi:hypothetical protein